MVQAKTHPHAVVPTFVPLSIPHLHALFVCLIRCILNKASLHCTTATAH